VKLGNPNPGPAATMGHAANRAAADGFAERVQPIIDGLRKAGVTSHVALAEAPHEVAGGVQRQFETFSCATLGPE
jgi:hypothetical protein